MINLLAAKGFRTVPETARVYTEAEIAGGRTIEQIRADVVELQRVLFRLQLEVERGLPVNEVIFLDVAAPGSLAWYRLFGLNPNEALPACFRRYYASVFALEPLPIRLDGLRFRDETITRFLDE